MVLFKAVLLENSPEGVEVDDALECCVEPTVFSLIDEPYALLYILVILDFESACWFFKLLLCMFIFSLFLPGVIFSLTFYRGFISLDTKKKLNGDFTFSLLYRER